MTSITRYPVDRLNPIAYVEYFHKISETHRILSVYDARPTFISGSEGCGICFPSH
jgi:hypothetical protein